MSSPSPPLQVGWLLDVENVPINLKASGLTAHTAIIAQSGSGKSFTLGRLLEEIVSKTLARILVLDPNSDFVKFSEVNEAVRKNTKLKKLFPPGDSATTFQKR